MKWLDYGSAASRAASATRNSEATFYTRDKHGQYHLWPRPSLWRRLATFFKGLSKTQ